MTVAAAEEGRLRVGRDTERELERLFDRHADDVRRYVVMVLRNRSDAEDIVQQTFLKALRALRAGVSPERPRQWLVAIAHNECRMHFRQASRRPSEVELDVVVDQASIDDGAPSADEIREALAHLAPNQRAALVMRELEDRSYAEIAAALEVSESAVETLLFRARRALREQFEDKGDCDDAQLLLAADSLDELSRKRLRAHTRSCRACATLERRRRGKLAAAGRKLGAIFPFPSSWSSLFGGGAAKVAIAVAAATLAAGGAVEVAKTDSTRPKPSTPELQHDAIRPTPVPGSTGRATPVAAARATAARRGSTPADSGRDATGRLLKPLTDGKSVATPSQAPHVDDHLFPAEELSGSHPQPAPPRRPQLPGTQAQPAAPTSARTRPTRRPPRTSPGGSGGKAVLPPLPSVPPLPAVPPLPEVTKASPLPLPEPPALPEPPSVP
jgi:RNA polymerase sigma-70 factor (ECF subfamily)